MDADDGVQGKQFSENVERNAVVGVVECGHQHQAVGDVEIGVAGRQALTFKNDRRGKRQLHNAIGFVVAVAGHEKPMEIFLQRSVIFIVSIRLDGGDDGV